MFLDVMIQKKEINQITHAYTDTEPSIICK